MLRLWNNYAPEIFFKNLALIFGILKMPLLREVKGETPSPAYADAKGGENMDEPARSQWPDTLCVQCLLQAHKGVGQVDTVLQELIEKTVGRQMKRN